MFWNKLSIGWKISLGFGTLLIMLLLVVILSFTGTSRIVVFGKQVIDSNMVKSLLIEMELQQGKFAEKINVFLADPGTVKFDIGADAKGNPVGILVYSDKRKRAESMVPELSPLLKRMEDELEILHAAAVEVGKKTYKASSNLPVFFNSVEMDILKLDNEINEYFMINRPEFKVSADLQNTRLGQWLKGDEAKQLLRQNKELAPSVQALEVAVKDREPSVRKLCREALDRLQA